LHNIELFFQFAIKGVLPRAVECAGQMPFAIFSLNIVFVQKADFNIGIEIVKFHIIPSFLLEAKGFNPWLYRSQCH